MFKLLLFTFLCVVILQLSIAFKVQCKNAGQIRQDHIHNCCKHPDGHNAITEECARETNFTLPSYDEQAIEDFTAQQLNPRPCWSKCIFDKLNFMKLDDLDMNAVRLHYRSVHKTDPEYEREMVNAFESCHGPYEAVTVEFLSLPFIRFLWRAQYCDQKSSVIHACVIRKFFYNCPRARWSNTTECLETREFARKCKDVLPTMNST